MFLYAFRSKKAKKMCLALTIIAVLIIFWLYAFFSANDLSVPTQTVDNISEVLVVFPHPDDEALSTSGLLTKLNKQDSKVNYLVLTKGERGTPDAHLDERLKGIREKEIEQASGITGIDQLSLVDIPDGEVENSKEEVRDLVIEQIEQVEPDLIITFDLAGLYGHPDHIATSEIVTNLVREKYSDIKLWYISYPRKILEKTSLPEHMAKDDRFKKRRVYPTHKIYVGPFGIMAKTKVIYTYKSQLEAFKKTFPIKQLPLWFYTSLMSYEYYYEAN